MKDNNFPSSDAYKLRSQFDKLVMNSLDYFAEILAFACYSVNQEIIEASDILSQLPIPDSPNQINVTDHLLTRQEALALGDNMLHDTYMYEQKMMHCIKNGLIEELNSMGGIDNNLHIGIPVKDPVRYYRDLLLAQNTLVSRAAIEGVLAPEAAYSLSDYFVLQIESCHTIAQFSQISQEINTYFCKCVQEIKYPRTDDATVNKAIQYIIEHVHENLSTQQIADYLDTSCDYISRKFKKMTGSSIPDFINQQKVTVAKTLLKYSDRTLATISNQLSYSSQSYFQTQFKRITGMTPNEYRNSVTDKS